jgi:hypothetical protein
MDTIFGGFLEMQHRDSAALAASSDILALARLEQQIWLASFACCGVARESDGAIIDTDLFLVGYRFSDDYLRRADPSQVISLLEPANVFHPNIRPPFVCLGRIDPGTPLVELLFRTYDLLTWRNFTPREDDSFDRAACAWARRNLDRFPTDPRPLKRRSLPAPAQEASL